MRSWLKTTSAVMILAAASLATAPAPASAQMAVLDIKSLVQARKAFDQATGQLNALKAQLEKLKTDVTQPLASINQQATQLLQQAQAIGYSGQDLASQFANLYPTDLSGQSFAQLQARLKSWDSNSRLTIQDSMRIQNQLVQSQAITASAVTSAVAASQGAEGQTAATQATNQLLAAVSSQLQGLQTIMVTQARTQETILAQQQAALTAARAESARHNSYTPVQGSFTDRTTF